MCEREHHQLTGTKRTEIKIWLYCFLTSWNQVYTKYKSLHKAEFRIKSTVRQQQVIKRD